ncbi:hypothetical protein ACFLQL_01635, partial [Verrucomicrobiota bacterium]
MKKKENKELKKFMLISPPKLNGFPMRRVYWEEDIEEPYVEPSVKGYYGFFHKWVNEVIPMCGQPTLVVYALVEDTNGKNYLVNMHDVKFINDEVRR